MEGARLGASATWGCWEEGWLLGALATWVSGLRPHVVRSVLFGPKINALALYLFVIYVLLP